MCLTFPLASVPITPPFQLEADGSLSTHVSRLRFLPGFVEYAVRSVRVETVPSMSSAVCFLSSDSCRLFPAVRFLSSSRLFPAVRLLLSGRLFPVVRLLLSASRHLTLVVCFPSSDSCRLLPVVCSFWSPRSVTFPQFATLLRSATFPWLDIFFICFPTLCLLTDSIETPEKFVSRIRDAYFRSVVSDIGLSGWDRVVRATAPVTVAYADSGD